MGHISIKRGDDYLLIGAHNWRGSDGISGQPYFTDDGGPSWKFNTLVYWDGGTANGGKCLSQTASGAQYAGCQGFWSPDNHVSHKETANYSFVTADLRPAYLDRSGTSTLNSYFRTFLNIGGDVTLVYDRVDVTSTSSTRQLHWNTPAADTAATPGNATALSVDGSVASATVGGSTIWINTLLPLSPVVTQVTNTRFWGDATNMGTQRFVVSDPNPAISTKSVFLTVLAATDVSVASMPNSSLIDAGNYRGAAYCDGVMPRVGLFSADGTPQNGVVYSVDDSSGQSARHVVLDLMPGLYIVNKDGDLVQSGIRVDEDGSMSFEAHGGGSYSITPMPPRSRGSNPPPSHPYPR